MQRFDEFGPKEAERRDVVEIMAAPWDAIAGEILTLGRAKRSPS